MTREELPRVLVVAHNPFNPSQSNGRTMSNLFSDWPTGALAQIYIPFQTHIPPSSDLCQSYWAITPNAIVRDFVRARSREVVLGTGMVDGAPGRLRALGRLKGLAKSPTALRLADPIREGLYSSPSVVSRPLLDWARRHRPQVLYTMMGSIHSMRIAVRVADALDIPIVPHFTDDWASTLYQNSLFSSRLRKRLNFWLNEILRRSPQRIAIGPGMAEEFTRRYGGVFHPLANPAEPNDFNPAPREDRQGGDVRLLYAGNLRLNRGEVLFKVGRSLQRLAKAGVQATLEVYCPPGDQELLEHGGNPHVRMKGYVSAERIPSVLHESDVVCLVESPDPSNRDYTRLSFSTKISEYLMAGRAILAIGPEGQTSFEYVHAERAGIFVTDTSDDALDAQIGRLVLESEERGSMGRRGRLLAEREHSRAEVTARFARIMSEAARQGNGR